MYLVFLKVISNLHSCLQLALTTFVVGFFSLHQVLKSTCRACNCIRSKYNLLGLLVFHNSQIHCIAQDVSGLSRKDIA